MNDNTKQEAEQIAAELRKAAQKIEQNPRAGIAMAISTCGRWADAGYAEELNPLRKRIEELIAHGWLYDDGRIDTREIALAIRRMALTLSVAVTPQAE